MLCDIILIAQTPSTDSSMWQVLGQFGFNAALVIWLLTQRSKEVKEERVEREKMANSIDRMALSITTLILSMSFLPHPFKEQAERIQREIDSEREMGK